MYTPETKKISQLLQVPQQTNPPGHHVDEWGGTEGIITIRNFRRARWRDRDEYDDEEIMFSVLPGGGWVVDGR
jgi:CBS domain containing-hemolysin-like protein